MTLPASGAISLNEIHVEAGGSSGSLCGVNDADIRDLIGKSSGASMSFSEWYGVSRESHVLTQGSYSGSGVNYYGYFINGSISPTTFGSSYTIQHFYRRTDYQGNSAAQLWFWANGSGTVPTTAFTTLKIYFANGTNVSLAASAATTAANSSYTYWIWDTGDFTTAQFSQFNTDFDGSGNIDLKIT